jgi:hypothetical protein
MPLAIDSPTPIAVAPAVARSSVERKPLSPTENRAPEGSQASRDSVELTSRGRLLAEVDALLHPAATEDGEKYVFPPLRAAGEEVEEQSEEAPSPPLGEGEEREQAAPLPAAATSDAPQQNAAPEQSPSLAPPISDAVPEGSEPIIPPPPAQPVSPPAPKISGTPEKNPEGSSVENKKEGTGPTGQEELTEDEQREVEQLKNRDREVRAHEQAHLAAAGPYARGGPRYDFESGPDKRRYAVGGEVSIDTSSISGDPEATIRKAQVVRRAAQAPAEPSSQDRQIAAQAGRMESKARQELSQQRMEEMRGGGEGDDRGDTSDAEVAGASATDSSSEKRASGETSEKIDMSALVGSGAPIRSAPDGETPTYGTRPESRSSSIFAPTEGNANEGGLSSIEAQSRTHAIPEPTTPSVSDASPRSSFSGSVTLDPEEIPQVDTGASMGGIAVLKKFNGYGSASTGSALDLTA